LLPDNGCRSKCSRSSLASSASIDDRYRDTPYYLAPEDKVGQEAFAVIRDAMKKKKMTPFNGLFYC
jgi:non-homologous end joining protein Ku